MHRSVGLKLSEVMSRSVTRQMDRALEKIIDLEILVIELCCSTEYACIYEQRDIISEKFKIHAMDMYQSAAFGLSNSQAEDRVENLMAIHTDYDYHSVNIIELKMLYIWLNFKHSALWG